MRECCFVVERDAWLRGEFTLSSLDVLQGFSFFLQMGFTLILATLDGLDVGLLGDVIGEDDCDDDEVEEHSLGDLGEPANYKAAMLDPESKKWVDAMNAEMQSMIDNMVWVLVDLPPNCKTVGSKWIFKKKTDMDGNVHIYKARLVAKGYTQTYMVDYEETFSPVADIRAIRILISIATFYDYEI
ncbi:putative retrotransposon ty1-copia subclass protein [Tanacetum coccineum]